MQTMNISLPERLKSYVEEQVGSGRYSTASEYVRELIRSDEKRREREKLEAMLLEGVRSGEPIPVTAEYWEEKQRKLAAKSESEPSGNGAGR